MPPKKPATRHLLSERFSDPDLVDRIFEYVVAEFPEMRAAPAKVVELKAAARAEFSGQQFYIPSQSPTDRQRLVADVLRLFNGRNATEVARRLNISRASVYRYIKQPAPVKKLSQLSET